MQDVGCWGQGRSPLHPESSILHPQSGVIMSAHIYYDKECDLNVLKAKTIAIIGYGSQGHAQAQNLRDSGVNVIIGQRPGGKNYDLAVEHGFKPVSASELAQQADIIQ